MVVLTDGLVSRSYVYVRPGLFVRAPAVAACWRLLAAGHRLTVDADWLHLTVEQARGVAIDPGDWADLQRWIDDATIYVGAVMRDERMSPGRGEGAHA